MSINYYDPYNRYRSRRMTRFVRFMMFVMALALAATGGGWLGRQYAAEKMIVLRDQLASSDAQRGALQESATRLRTEAETARLRLKQLQEQYENEFPSQGEARRLYALVRSQLEEGIDPQRLAFVIRSARPPQNCTDPETRRFVISTPAYNGPDSNISVAEGAIIITGTGLSARNADWQPEAWYDPAQPVTISFTTLGGERQQKSGTLPLHHSLVLDDREFRFTITEGAKSFVRVAYDSCAYP